MNLTESFLLQMAITYLGLMTATNTSLTPVQQAAIQQAIAANEGVILAFTKPTA